MKKKFMSVLFLMFFVFQAVLAFAEPIFEEDFSQNTALDGWKMYQWDMTSTTSRAELSDDAVGTMSVVNDSEYGSVLQIVDNSEDKIVRAERTISDPVLDGKYVIEYDIKPGDAGTIVLGNAANKYQQDANSYYIHVAHPKGDKVEIRGNGSPITSTNKYPTTQWHHVKIVMNIAGKAADVFVDGDHIGERIGFRYSNTAPLDTVAVGSMFHGSNKLKTLTQFANLTISPASMAEFPAGAKLTVSRNFGESLELAWPKATGAVKYSLYQNGEEIAVLEPETTNYSVTGLTPGQDYTFAVQAEDANGLLTGDGPSDTVTAFEMEQVIYKGDFSGGSSDWKLFRHEGGTGTRTENDSEQNGAITFKADATYGDTMVVSDTSETYIMRAEAPFPGYVSACRVEFDAKLAANSLIALADSGYYSANSNNYMIHILQSGNAFQVRGGSIVDSSKDFAPNEWRHFEIVIDNSSNVRGSASVWADGKLIADKLLFRCGNKGQSLDTIIVGSTYSIVPTPVTQIANLKVVKVGTSDWAEAPVLEVVENTEDGLTIRWDHAEQPAQYLVLVDGGIYDIIDGGVNSYTAGGLEEATKYMFEVRALDADGVASSMAAKKEIKTYNPNGFTVQIEGFYLADDEETLIEAFAQGKIRTKLKVTNDNSPVGEVTVLALQYQVANGARQLLGINAVSGIAAEQGAEIPVTIDVLTAAQANCLEICLIDTMNGVMPLSKAFALE